MFARFGKKLYFCSVIIKNKENEQAVRIFLLLLLFLLCKPLQSGKLRVDFNLGQRNRQTSI